MMDAEEARRRWLEERQAYHEFAELIAARVKTAMQECGIWCETSSRAKEPYSLIKKLLNGKHTYDSVPDKAGARCIVRYISDLGFVRSQAQRLFECSESDDKLRALGTDRVGYNSVHVQVRLKDRDPELLKCVLSARLHDLI